METTKKYPPGPTVVEACNARLIQINREIEDLNSEKFALMARRREYWDSKMLESERRATAAEPYQKTQLQ